MQWTDWLMLFLIAAPCTAVAVILNTNFREGRCIGCGKCSGEPNGRCIFGSGDRKRAEQKKRN